MLALGTFSKMRSTFRLTIGCVLLILMSQVESIETHVQGQNVDDPDSDLEGTLTSVFSWVSGPLTNAMHTDTNTCIQPHTDTHFIYTMIE